MAEEKMKKIELHPGRQVRGTIKSIRQSPDQKIQKISDIVLEDREKKWILRVKGDYVKKFKVGNVIAVRQTQQGLKVDFTRSKKISINKMMR